MKRTSLVLTLLLTLILVGCTATPLPTLVATVSTEDLPTPLVTNTPVETLLPTPTLTVPVPTATLTVSPLPSLPTETPTIVSTRTIPFAPGSVIFTQTPKSKSSEPGPGLEIVDNLFWAIPGSQPDAWTITPLPVGLVWEIHPSPDETTLAMRYIDNFQVEQLALYFLLNKQLIPVPDTEKFSDLSWWPDGQTVLYAKSANLFSVDTSDLLVEALTDNPSPIDGEPYTYFTDLEVSPDGLWIATKVMRGIGLPDNGFLPTSRDLGLFDIEQHQHVIVADNVGSYFVDLQWAVDSELFVFTHEHNKGLYVFDVNRLEVLTLGDDLVAPYFSNWSPNGQLLAYAHHTTLSLWDKQSRMSRELTQGEHISKPYWSPDGNYIAIGFRVEERAGIMLLDPATGEQQEYLLGFSVDWLRWSPDNQWLVYPAGTALQVLSIADGISYLLLPSNEEMNPPQSVFWLHSTIQE